MKLSDLKYLTATPCAWPAWQGTLPREELVSICQHLKKMDAQLLALWGSDERAIKDCFVLHLLLVIWDAGTVYLHCDLSASTPVYSDISATFPAAARMQRAVYDLLGIQAENAADQRPWLRHAAWPADVFPLRNDVALMAEYPNLADHYSFVRVSGEGVHEIPVGPIHAGIIESGHFHFQVIGEQVLRLEERFAYAHKGIGKQFQGRNFFEGAKLAGRISGDSTVAYAFAYSMAIENLLSLIVPARAVWLRAILLERERIINHLGDLGALGNDTGLSFGLSQFSRLKEDAVRLNLQLFQHRYCMDVIVPGGVTADIDQAAVCALLQQLEHIENETVLLQNIYAEHNGLQDRFATTGILALTTAKELGILGLAARASGLKQDWRMQFPAPPYTEVPINLCFETAGDVAARVNVRFREITESCRLLRLLLENLPAGNVIQTVHPATVSEKPGFGCVEGWRGPIVIIVCSHQDAKIKWAHTQDPSWQNWPALEHAIGGNIVPDFPLINKSFNLSYSGQDG